MTPLSSASATAGVGWLCVCTAALGEELTSQSSPSLQISHSERDNVQTWKETWNLSGLVADAIKGSQIGNMLSAFHWELCAIKSQSTNRRAAGRRVRWWIPTTPEHASHCLFGVIKTRCVLKKPVWEWFSRKLWASFNIFSHVRYWNGKTKSVSDVSKLQCRCVNRRGQQVISDVELAAERLRLKGALVSGTVALMVHQPWRFQHWRGSIALRQLVTDSDPLSLPSRIQTWPSHYCNILFLPFFSKQQGSKTKQTNKTWKNRQKQKLFSNWKYAKCSSGVRQHVCMSMHTMIDPCLSHKR